jgi:hypothetical protein
MKMKLDLNFTNSTNPYVKHNGHEYEIKAKSFG